MRTPDSNSDPLEDEMRALLQPISPKLKARIGHDLNRASADVRTAWLRTERWIAAGVMAVLTVGLFTLVHLTRSTRLNSPLDQQVAQLSPGAESGGASTEQSEPPGPRPAPPAPSPQAQPESSDLARPKAEAQNEAEKARERDHELFKQRVSKLIAQADELRVAGDLEAAEQLAVKILTIDPDNKQAATLQELIRTQAAMAKLKGVIVKQQQSVVVERENAAREREEKRKLEAELNAVNTALADVVAKDYAGALELYNQGKFEDSRQKLRDVLARNPSKELVGRLIDEYGVKTAAKMMADVRMGNEPTLLWQAYRKGRTSPERVEKLKARLQDENISADERALIQRELDEQAELAKPPAPKAP